MTLAAIPVAALGGDLFLKGMLGLATWSRLPRFLVATTLAAFATSSPELTLSTMAALSGKPEIGLGDALGSNVVNIALILGLSLAFGAMPASLEGLRRDYLLAVATPLVTLVLCLDGTVSRLDGGILLALFASWLAMVFRQGIASRRTTEHAPQSEISLVLALLGGIAGLACLILAGILFVDGASDIAAGLGVQDYVIGATIVAIGTSMPELVTTLLSRLRGQHDLSLGILLGSCLFNGLAVIGIASAIQAIHAPQPEVGLALVFGVVAVLMMQPRGGEIARYRGAILLALYLAFVVTTAAM
ncbi:sodium:calcium antiporter [Emcibacter sp. SYSU 3D8]|uniref:sodium:calcium antiporter n=1 Tax=Emcibacter sp. SYSU 3D8 TaxID=3133969 RepID=UPI0031FE4A0B